MLSVKKVWLIVGIDSGGVLKTDSGDMKVMNSKEVAQIIIEENSLESFKIVEAKLYFVC